ncbi:3-keto-disaccharide hydrolase [Thalassotalea sp. PLHSN55]|uniref:3-keto-disaccharide hydrolase n=1 Tax=Thalassotalea sp. PLHSN55 TaxID=3435888 RepID=UPI003F854231
MNQKHIIASFLTAFSLTACTSTVEHKIAPQQHKWITFYEAQKNIVAPEKALLNTEKEPVITADFVDLYKGKDLSNWTVRGGFSSFTAKEDYIEGVALKKSPSTYLSTNKANFKDFVFTMEVKWLEDGNSGVIVRGNTKPGKKGSIYKTVFGPQVEMEDFKRKRYWSGGIYGQSAGAWHYPLWLEAHETARQAIKREDWNRLTVKVVGDNYKTWVNGIPAAHWNDEKSQFKQGFFSLQIHAGGRGKIRFKNIKVKEL